MAQKVSVMNLPYGLLKLNQDEHLFNTETRDRPGGHIPDWFVSGACAQRSAKGRKFGKKMDKRKARKQRKKIIAEALQDYDDYNTDLQTELMMAAEEDAIADSFTSEWPDHMDEYDYRDYDSYDYDYDNDAYWYNYELDYVLLSNTPERQKTHAIDAILDARLSYEISHEDAIQLIDDIYKSHGFKPNNN